VVEGYGPDVEVLAALPVVPDGSAVPDGTGGAPSPVICRQGSVLVAAFHPELTEDRRLHRLFVDMTKEEKRR
jgi:5'-phosphate synthase pdxT subunit